jgi:hypothetical protein
MGVWNPRADNSQFSNARNSSPLTFLRALLFPAFLIILFLIVCYPPYISYLIFFDIFDVIINFSFGGTFWDCMKKKIICVEFWINDMQIRCKFALSMYIYKSAMGNGNLQKLLIENNCSVFWLLFQAWNNQTTQTLYRVFFFLIKVN